ncbi:MAG: type II toxin-antitoxin system VapC family toxin [Deltaproteobacteria bacterium]|nr:MAG: type II toxin-antitoxin system VapC family toxin [Deltaproteobacteria bacterium]TMA70387.1 MAG: type II toxin-antitoxin system VapC family toxin [Deltaproteobacteria bacterium]TMB23920.1 MAG: type II toxin-antitoxin system VapC family toxin [Deltaproteobacteria bacterium]
MTLVDTNVLLDVLLEGARHGDESEGRLAAALRAGPVVVNDVIAAELAPLFDGEADLWRVLASAQIQHVPYPRPAIYIAGQAFLRYRRGGGARHRIMPDFMIGAHAVVSGARLLTRDRGFYRSRFPGLRLAR